MQQTIFDNAGVFFMFAFAMGAGAYLRALSAASLEIAGKILQRSGIGPYPYDFYDDGLNDAKYNIACERYVTHLLNMRSKLRYVTHLAFALMVAFAFSRATLCAEGFWRKAARVANARSL